MCVLYICTVRVSVVCVCTFLCMCLGIRCGAHEGSSEDSLGYLSSCITLVLTVTYAKHTIWPLNFWRCSVCTYN